MNWVKNPCKSLISVLHKGLLAINKVATCLQGELLFRTMCNTAAKRKGLSSTNTQASSRFDAAVTASDVRDSPPEYRALHLLPTLFSEDFMESVALTLLSFALCVIAMKL